jgi:hypothetical protein
MGSVLKTRFAYLFWNPTVDTRQNEKYHATRVTYGKSAATFLNDPRVPYGVFKSTATFLNDPRVPYGVFKSTATFAQTDNSVGYLRCLQNLPLLLKICLTHGFLTVSPLLSKSVWPPRVPYGVFKSAATFAQTYIDGTRPPCSLFGLGLWHRILCGLVCCMGSVLDPLETRFYTFYLKSYLFCSWNTPKLKTPCNAG